MGNELIIPITGMFGYLMQDRSLYLILQMGIGYLRITDGPGLRITTGDGQYFIMAAGVITIRLDGFGYLIQNGVLHG